MSDETSDEQTNENDHGDPIPRAPETLTGPPLRDHRL